MRISSKKQKGKRLCKEAADIILNIFTELESGDISIPASSCPGEDLWLSPKAKSLIPLVFEMKNQENTKPWQWIAQSKTHSKDGRCPVVVFSRNHEPEPYAIISFRDLLGLVKK